MILTSHAFLGIDQKVETNTELKALVCVQRTSKDGGARSKAVIKTRRSSRVLLLQCKSGQQIQYRNRATTVGLGRDGATGC